MACGHEGEKGGKYKQMSHYSESPEVKNHHTQMNTHSRPTLKKSIHAQTLIQQSKHIHTQLRALVQQRKQQRKRLHTNKHSH